MIFITVVIGFILSTAWIIYEYSIAPKMEEVDDIMDENG